MIQEVFEKIIEKLEKSADELYKEYCIGFNSDDRAGYDACVNAIEIVKQEAAECNNGWIPCGERLPERNKPVLCWVTSTTIASGETYIIGSCDNGFWFLQTYEIGHHHFPVKDYEVIAWQPLPEPYQPKGE